MTTNFHAIIITGASSGIGAALAEHYAAPDMHLFLTGRNKERLTALTERCTEKGANVETAMIDVTDKHAMTETFQRWDKKYPIDLIVANAGISQKGVEDRARVEEILNTNINGVVNTIYPLLPNMKGRKAGQIAILSSLAGFRGMPTAASYSASKNAVRALGDALRPELKRHNITMTVICPGFIKTPLTDVNPFPMPFLMTAEKAARIIAGAIQKKRKRITFPWPMAIATWLLASLPVAITDPIITKMSLTKRKKNT